MQDVKLFLDAINPALFYIICVGIVNLVIYAWRKFSIKTYDAVTKKNPKIQQIPTLLLAALLAASPEWGKDFASVVFDVLAGVFLIGGGSILSHHTAKALPFLPYEGGRDKQE